MTKSLLEARPPAYFALETPGIECGVYICPELDVRGQLTSDYGHNRIIKLREYDESVLLHEVLHRIFELQNEMPMTQEQEEILVGRIEKTLYAMGWRWTENLPWAVVDGKAVRLTTCKKPATVTWETGPSKWARDEDGHLYYNTSGVWHRAQVGL